MALLNDAADLPLSMLSIAHKTKTAIAKDPDWQLREFSDNLRDATLPFFVSIPIDLAGRLPGLGWIQSRSKRHNRWVEARIKALLHQMSQATTLEEYQTCTTALDILQGHNEWKRQFDSVEPSYCPEIIKEHMESLQNCMEHLNAEGLLRIIRTEMDRNLGGMNMLRLYKHSWFGTKELIEKYNATAVEAIDRFLELTDDPKISQKTLHNHLLALQDAQTRFGRTALSLSGGATLGMKHIGVVQALFQAGLLPHVISGTSAGSIVAGIVGCATDAEMEDRLSKFAESDLNVFDTSKGLFEYGYNRCRVMSEKGALFEMGPNLQRIMKAWLGNITFKEAWNKTGRCLNITVSSSDGSEARLLNHSTSPNVYVYSAICASCSVPFIFKAAQILQKDPVTGNDLPYAGAAMEWQDGSVDTDIPSRKLAEELNVNHFIVSQVNPHVRFFISHEEAFQGSQPTSAVPTKLLAHRIYTCSAAAARDEFIHRSHQLASIMPQTLERFPSMAASILSQQYTGDINIFPPIESTEFLTLLRNPTREFMLKAREDGVRATWPKMCRLENSVAIELAIHHAVKVMRDRVNFGPEAAKGREKERRDQRRSPLRGRRSSLSSEIRVCWHKEMEKDRGINGAIALDTFGSDFNTPPSPDVPMRRSGSEGDVVRMWGLFGMTSRSRSRTPAPTGLVIQPITLAPQAGISDELTTKTPSALPDDQIRSLSSGNNGYFSFPDDSDLESERSLVAESPLPRQSAPSSPYERFKNFWART